MEDNAAGRQAAPALPPLVKLTEPRWKWMGELYDASEIPEDFVFGAEPLERVVVPNDPINFVILSPLKRGHRRYRSEDELSGNSYYVGIEGGTFAPVFVRGPGKRSPPDMSNSYCGVLLGIGSTNQPSRIIIPPVDMLRPRQLSFLKIQSLGTEHQPNDQPAFRQVSDGEKEQYQRSQQDAFLSGRGCAVLVEDPTAEPDYNVFNHMKEDRWELFQMDLPKLAAIKIPKGLVDEIKSFLVKYPRDIVPINLAVSMAIAWWAYSNTFQYRPELAASRKRKLLQISEVNAHNFRPVPQVSLAVLILYSTHYFRIHEEHRLSAYGHIFRIISWMYKKDTSVDAAFEINTEDIDHRLISRYVSGMELKDADWEEIAPPSFDGSRIPMPKNYGTRAPPSPELTASLMMPDIYTIGFPGYTNEVRRGHDGVTRDVMMHGSWVPKHVLASDGWTALDQEHLDADILEPYHDQEPRQLWTAPQTKVRPPWPEMATVDIPPPPPPVEEPLASAAAATAAAAEKPQNPLPASKADDPAAKESYSRDFLLRSLTTYFDLHVADVRMAQEAGFISKLVSLGPDGHLTWPNQPKRLKKTPKLPCEIDIKKMVADDAAAAKDRISEKNRLILGTILKEDLASDKHVAECLLPLRMIDVNEINLSRRRVEAAITAAARPMQKAMKQVLDYGSSVRTGGCNDNDFTNKLLRPCCELLGLDASRSPSECKDAIHHVERDLHAAIVNVEFVVRYQRENAESFKIAMNLITAAPCFKYISRLTMFNMRVRGTGFNEDDKKVWARIFGEPFEDDGGN